jgi:O-antigen ligase
MSSSIYHRTVPPRLVTSSVRAGVDAPHRIPPLLRFSFLLFVFTIPIESLNVTLSLGPYSLARVSGLLLFAVSGLYYKRCYSVLCSPLYWFSGYLVIFVVTGAFISTIYQPIFMTRLFTLVQLVIFFWIGSNLLRNEKFSRTVLLTYALAAVFLTLAVSLGLPGFSQGVLDTKEGDRFSALNTNPNYLGMVLALATVILTGLALVKKRRGQLFVVPVIILLVMMVGTGSRAAILAFVGGVYLYLLPLRANRRKLVAITTAGFALLGAVYLVLGSDTLMLRWSAALNEGDSAGRDRIVTSTLSMIAERPILGSGPVETGFELRRRLGWFDDLEQDTHNLELSVLAENGIVGGILFLTGIFLCGVAAWKHRNGQLGMVPLALLVTLSIGLQFHTFLTTKPVWLVFAVCAAANGFGTSQVGFRRIGTYPSYEFSRSRVALNSTLHSIL